ncbi:MAG TPA: hypothetical protein VJ792_03260 [Candidatus Nitrosotalea sp.]|nr:hypothetical protein [Candidatus Nitrosotalea sp.]
MNRYLIAGIIAAFAGIIFSIPLLSDHFVTAGTVKKIQFTQTLTSTEDPGLGHGNEQLAMVLAPNNGTLYGGTLTYTASAPVQIIVLHKIDRSDSRGQPVWTVDNSTIYAETVLDQGSGGGTLDFAGSAVGIHSINSTQFTATVSVDGWIRGATPEFQNATQVLPVNAIKLSQAEVPVKIPLHDGFYNGGQVYYIVTDASNSADAGKISDKQGWKVQTAPLLAQSPQKLLTKVYVFTNGVFGQGMEGFQGDVFSDAPSSKNYTPVALVVHAKWNAGRTVQVLNSTQAILAANSTGKLTLTTTSTVLNMPQVVWPGGQMEVRSNKELSDQNAYVGGQVLDIDNSTYKDVTFVAHRGWGPDGKTVYYIVTGGTPEGPAKMMGLMNTPALALLSSVGRDIYHFSNGIAGAGPFGFQEGISGAQPGDTSYSPVCKVSMVTWKDNSAATVLENTDDIDLEKSQGSIDVSPALVYGNNFVVDCPIIEIPKSNS